MHTFYNQMIKKIPPFAVPIIKILIIITVTAIVVDITGRLIDRFFILWQGEKHNRVSEKKKKTLTGLLKSIVRYTSYFVAGISILDIFGVHTQSLITAAGVGGLAVGFGAQNLVKDIISGFFIIFEDQYNVGDYIETSGVSGTVEEIGLRSTQLRDFGGQLHIIPNGSIELVTNYSKGKMRALVTIAVTYEEDLKKVFEVLDEVCKKVKENRKDIIDGPNVLGVTELSASAVVITIIAKTVPMMQWSVEREIRKAILESFEAEGIKIPYPKTILLQENM